MSDSIGASSPITVLQAYAAMYKYLEHLQSLSHSEDLAGFLGGMSMLPGEQGTADPAAWEDWLRIVETVKGAFPDIGLHLKR